MIHVIFYKKIVSINSFFVFSSWREYLKYFAVSFYAAYSSLHILLANLFHDIKLSLKSSITSCGITFL